MTANQIQKRLLKKENEVIKMAKMFATTHDIPFNKQHEDIVRNSMREFFQEGIYPVVKELFLTLTKDGNGNK